MIVNNINDIGLLIRKRRKNQGLTQAEFSEVAGVGVRIVSEVERGKNSAEIGKVLTLMKYAGLEIDIKEK